MMVGKNGNAHVPDILVLVTRLNIDNAMNVNALLMTRVQIATSSAHGLNGHHVHRKSSP